MSSAWMWAVIIFDVLSAECCQGRWRGPTRGSTPTVRSGDRRHQRNWSCDGVGTKTHIAQRTAVLNDMVSRYSGK